MKITKKLSKLVALAVLLGGVSYGSSALAAPSAIIAIDASTGAASADTSLTDVSLGGSGSYIGVTGGALDYQVKMIEGSLSSTEDTYDLYGIKIDGSAVITASCIFEGIFIDVTCFGGGTSYGVYISNNVSVENNIAEVTTISAVSGEESSSYGINFNGVGTTTIGVESIVTKSFYGKACGIYAKNTNTASVDATFTVDLKSGSISSYSYDYLNYGILFDAGSTGTSNIMNVDTINAGFDGGDISTGNVSGIKVHAGSNNVTFNGDNRIITAKSDVDGSVYGICYDGIGNTTIEGLYQIKAIQGSEDEDCYGNAYGISANHNNTTDTFKVEFDETNGGVISAYSKYGESSGIKFNSGNNGINSVLNVKTITAGIDPDVAANISSGAAYGIQAMGGANNVTFTGADSSITAKSNGSNVYGIALGTSSTAATGTTTITGLGSITAETTSTDATNKNAYGIYSKNGNTSGASDPEFSVSFVDAGGSISAYSATGENYGIKFESGSTGTSEVKNVKTITAGVKSGDPFAISADAAYGIQAMAGTNTVTFTGTNPSITAKSSGSAAYGITFGFPSVTSPVVATGTTIISGLGSINAYSAGKVSAGIYALTSTAIGQITFSDTDSSIVAKSDGGSAGGIILQGQGSHEVIGLGSITAETTSTSAHAYEKQAFGIYTTNTNADNTKKFSVSFDSTNGGSISAYSANGETDGIRFDSGSTGTSEVLNVKKITAGVKSGSNPEEISSGSAYGICAKAGTNTVTFSGENSSIIAKGNEVYGVGLDGTGTTKISNLGSITAITSGVGAMGIYINNSNTDTEATFSVAFADAGGSISVYANSVNQQNYGIRFAASDTTTPGKSEVTNVKTITAGVDPDNSANITSGTAYGIQALAGTNTVSFVEGSSITAKSGGADVYGIAFGNASTAATGTTTITGLGSITAETTSTDATYKNAYGIYSKNGNTAGASDPEFSVSFVDAGGSISAYSANGQNTGVRFYYGSTGKSEVLNVKTITAGVKGDSISAGAVFGIYSNGGINDVVFKENGSVIAKSNSMAYGICVAGSTLTVSNLGGTTDGITVSEGAVGYFTKICVGADGILNLSNSTIKETNNVTTILGDCGTGSCSMNLKSGTEVYGPVYVTKAGGTLTVNVDSTSEWHINKFDGTGAINVINSGKIFVEDKLDLSGTTSSITSDSGSGIYFVLPSDFNKSTDTMLKLGSGITIGNGVGVYVNAVAATGLTDGDVITLMDVGSNTITLDNSAVLQVWDGSKFVSTTDIKLDGTSKLVYAFESIKVTDVKPGDLTGNSIVVDGAKTAKIGSNTTAYTGKGDAWENVYGGYSESDTAEDVTGNELKLTGTAQVTGNIYGGYSKSGSATNNTVIWESGTVGGDVYGGDGNGSSKNYRSNNTLEIAGSGKTVGSVNNFQKYQFTMTETTAAGDTMLTLTREGLTFANGDSIVVKNAPAVNLKDGDMVNLVEVLANDKTIAFTDGQDSVDVSSDDGIGWTEANVSVSDDSKKLIYTQKAKGLKPDESKAPIEGVAAASVVANSSSDMATGVGMANLITSTSVAATNTETFGAGNFGKGKYKTGSHVDAEGYGIVVGVGRKRFDEAGNKITGGIFFEYGNSNFDTYNNNVTGDGKAIYKGAGYMMRFDNTCGNYYEGMLHGGKVTTSWGNASGGYEIAPRYYGGAVSYGHKFMLKEKRQLSVYGSYIVNHTEGADAKIGEYDYTFESTKSHRTRLGVRYAVSDLMDTTKVRPYMGLAWEHEFNGESKAHVAGFDEGPAAPSMKGNTGIMEMGFKQETGKWTLGVGAELFTGKRKGWNGTLQATLNF